MDWIYLAKDRD